MPTSLTVYGSPFSGGQDGNPPMLFEAAMVCLIGLSVSVLIAHAIDAFRT
jgi:hypothetical protein